MSKTGLTVLLGDGNAYAILGRCQNVLKRNNLEGDVKEFFEEATKSDYNNLIQVVNKWFDVVLEQDLLS